MGPFQEDTPFIVGARRRMIDTTATGEDYVRLNNILVRLHKAEKVPWEQASTADLFAHEFLLWAHTHDELGSKPDPRLMENGATFTRVLQKNIDLRTQAIEALCMHARFFDDCHVEQTTKANVAFTQKGVIAGRVINCARTKLSAAALARVEQMFVIQRRPQGSTPPQEMLQEAEV